MIFNIYIYKKFLMLTKAACDIVTVFYFNIYLKKYSCDG